MKAQVLPMSGPPPVRLTRGRDWRGLLESRELILIVATVLVTLIAGAVNRDFLAGSNLRFMLLNSVVLGLVYVCYTGSATATTGTGDHFELQSIATVLIGGTAVAGGRGSVLGTVLGSTFLSVILTALVFLHVPAIWYSAGEGLMILLAVTSASLRRSTGTGRAA